jgi:hypothetical protein
MKNISRTDSTSSRMHGDRLIPAAELALTTNSIAQLRKAAR